MPRLCSMKPRRALAFAGLRHAWAVPHAGRLRAGTCPDTSRQLTTTPAPPRCTIEWRDHMTQSIGPQIAISRDWPARLIDMKRIACGVLALVAFSCGDNSALPIDAAPDAAPLAIDAKVAQPDAPGAPPDAPIALACTIAELTPIFTCVQTSCAMDLTLACVTTRCGLLVLGLSPSCRTCVLTGLTSGDIAATTAACISGLPTPPTP